VKVVKIQILSDLHCECFGSLKTLNPFLESLTPEAEEDREVVVLAGDIGTTGSEVSQTMFFYVLDYFNEHWKQVLYVPGNHEYYKNNLWDCDKLFKKWELLLDNFVLLERECFIRENYPDIRFIGATMWFPERPLNSLYFDMMSDFHLIKNGMNELELRGEESIRYLKQYVQENDIVITHHMPTYQSVPKRFKNSRLNDFFVNELAEDIIANNKPKIWIHGHTHDSCDYMAGNTRVICNPYGYHGRESNSSFIYQLIIEV